jgi:hypothetical protein
LEVEIAQLNVAVSGMSAQAALPTPVDRSEGKIARVAAEAAELYTVVLALKGGTTPKVDALVITECPPLFEHFNQL